MSYEILNASSTAPGSRRADTKWLDGLRGVAAFIVFTNHYLFADFESLFYCPESESAPLFLKIFRWLPFLRIVFTARSMVAVFFVISGYCISCSALTLRDQRQTTRLLNSLCSSVLRRLARLYVPTIALIIISHTAFYLGMYSWALADLPPLSNPVPHIKFTLKEISDRLDIMYWLRVDDTGLNVQLWTISVELRGSFIVWLCILGLARVRAAIRPCFLFAISSHFMWCGRWDAACFVGGLLVAELKVLDERDDSTTPKSAWQFTTQVMRGICFVIGTYLVCLYDNDCFESHYYILFAVSPWAGFEGIIACWKATGAILFVYGISNFSFLQRPFKKRIIQFLGRISFSLYLVHILIIHMWKPPLNDFLTRQSEQHGKPGYLAIIGTYFVLWPITILAAHLFTKYIDAPSIPLTRWLETLVTSKE